MDALELTALQSRRSPLDSMTNGRISGTTWYTAIIAIPLLPITILKRAGSTETRTLLVPSVRDRILQTAVGFHLGVVIEDEFVHCSFPHRPHRSVNSAIARIRYLHSHGCQYVASADIASFFDTIDHELLRERMRARINRSELIDLADGWIQGSIWEGNRIKPLEKVSRKEALFRLCSRISSWKTSISPWKTPASS